MKQKGQINNNKRALVDWPQGRLYGHLPFAGCLMSVGSKQITVGNGDHALFFRYADSNSAGWTYFVYDSANLDASTVDPAWMAERYQNKQFGRVVVVPVTADPNCRWSEELYFRADGTGFVWPGPEQFEFSWAELWDWPVDVVTESVELLSSLGRIVFDKFNAALENPLIDPEALEDEPLEFINGSYEELETVTRWICHSEITQPKKSSNWDVTYSAPNIIHNREGGLLQWTFRESARLQELFSLAYEYNSFTGYHWEYNDEKADRQDSYDPQPLWISFQFSPASRDEQQAAREELRRWLGGKMTAEEIQSLLGGVDTP